MATSQTIPSAATQTPTVTITINVDSQQGVIWVDQNQASVLLTPGQSIKWVLASGTDPFAIAFANPLFAAPIMIFGTSSDASTPSGTPVFTIPMPLLSNGIATFSYQIMYMDIQTTSQYTFLTSDPVVIVDPSSGSSS